MTRHRTLLAALLVIAVSSAVAAHLASQDPGAEPEWMRYNRPGSQHDILDRLNGRWSQTITIWASPGEEADRATGTADYRWILGGRYLEGRYECYLGGELFQGVDLVGHDNFRNEFFSVWIDNRSTSRMLASGRYNEAKRELVFEGTQDDVVSGSRDQPFRLVHRFVDDDSIEVEMHRPGPDGSWARKVLIEAERID